MIQIRNNCQKGDGDSLNSSEDNIAPITNLDQIAIL